MSPQTSPVFQFPWYDREEVVPIAWIDTMHAILSPRKALSTRFSSHAVFLYLRQNSRLRKNRQHYPIDLQPYARNLSYGIRWQKQTIPFLLRHAYLKYVKSFQPHGYAFLGNSDVG